MLSRKDFPSLTKPPYGNGFSQKNVEAPEIATVKDFFRFCAATGKGKIVNKITCDTAHSMTQPGQTLYSRRGRTNFL
jgi:hypothetical protein